MSPDPAFSRARRANLAVEGNVIRPKANDIAEDQTSENGFVLHAERMSALGQKQTFELASVMSALPPKAVIMERTVGLLDLARVRPSF